jgi:predicted dienelactone hydrolase
VTKLRNTQDVRLLHRSMIKSGAEFCRALFQERGHGIKKRSMPTLTRGLASHVVSRQPLLNSGGRPVRVHLKGVHKVKRKLVNGGYSIHYYAWRGGPTIMAAPNTPEFIEQYAKAHANRRKAPSGLVIGLIAEFKASGEFPTNRDTIRAYNAYLKLIENEFGDMPIAALKDPEVRGEFKRWRDSMAATPRKADYAWTVLARVFAVAKDRGRIPINPCERGGRLYEADRRDKIWKADDIRSFFKEASRELCDAFMLGLWTGLRQGALLRLPWTAYDGTYIRLRLRRKGKKGAGHQSVIIPVGAPLKAILDGRKAQDRTATTILTNTRGRPWTSDGFRSSWDTAFRNAKLGDLAAANAREEPQWIGPPIVPFVSAGSAARDVAPAAGPRRPLILLSHGSGGMASLLAWLGTGLAAHGFIAVAVNHPGNNALEDYTVEGFSLWWLRAVDLSAVIDALLDDQTFGSQIDPANIGVAGHSLGGYTVIAIAGGVTEPARLQTFCRSPAADALCKPPPADSEMRQKRFARLSSDPDFRRRYSEANNSYRDERVRAIFAMAPGLGPVFTPESLGKISIPVAIVTGIADEIAPPTSGAEALAEAIPHATLKLFPQAGHYVFFGTCTTVGRLVVRVGCGDPGRTDRDTVHAETIRLALDFFSANLR